MNVSFGNLASLKHGLVEPDAPKKTKELMEELHKAGFVREQSTEKNNNQDPDVKSYHIYSMPYKIEFSSKEGAEEAIKIMTPYSKYLSPVAVVG